MTATNPVESLFFATLEKPPALRAAFLDEACGQDAELRRQVERLLAAQPEVGDFLERPAAAALPANAQPTVELRPSDRPDIVLAGKYKLLEEIGEGGMGTVWMAQQTEPVKRVVAIKLIKAGMDSEQVIARFEAERQALALMDHPNIARVLDGGTTDAGRPYFVMDLVKGVPITRYCDEHQLTPQQRLELFVPICQAIQHAHQKGIIHRDLKPSNVLVAQYDGRPVPKVIDFGVAKAAGQSLTDKTLVTGFGAIVGTLEYMSPEQAEINQFDVDTRSDIYSLGVLLYELLAGSTPFSKKDLEKAGMLEMLRVIREQEPSKPSTKLSSSDALPTLSANRSTEPAKLAKLLRGELDWIVMKALEKDRSRRYETANSFAMDVQRYLANEAVQACPPSAGYRLRKLVRRNKGPVLAASMVVLALVAGLIGTTWAMVRATDAEAEAVSAAKLKETALTAAQLSERDAKDSFWLSLYEQARARRYSRQMGQRLDSLDVLAKAARLRPDERLRDEAIAAMALPDVSLGPPWHGWPPGQHKMVFDAQYRLQARVSDQGVISVRSIPDNREIQSIDSGPINPNAWVGFFSPDGQYLATAEIGNRPLRVWRVADGKAILHSQPTQTRGWAFSPDSRQLAVGQQGRVIRFDLANGEEINRWELPSTATHLAFHQDNRRLAVGYQLSKFVSVYDATNVDLVTNLPVAETKEQFEQVVAWHPDGERLAVASSDPGIQIWNLAAKRKVATLEGHVQNVTSLSFHPDGDLLTSTSWDGTVRLWDPSTAQQLMQLPFHVSPRFSNDGRWLGIAASGEHAQLMEVTPTREYRTLVSSLGAGQGGYVFDMDISPDGLLLAQGMSDAVRLWHLASGRELAVLPKGRPLFQSNGELLIAGPGGLHRWPILPGAAANELRLGPPRTIPLPVVPYLAQRTPDGRKLAIFSYEGGDGLLEDLATDSVQAPRLRYSMIDYLALSPDGRWMATSGWQSAEIRLWNAGTGKKVDQWIPANSARAFFTPDSRALIISRRDEFSFLDVETRKPLRSIRRDVADYPSPVAFSSPDGGLMALEMAPGVIHLKDAATHRTVAKLEDPHGDRASWARFTPDGTQLVVTALYAKVVHVWDLRAIRTRLKEMNLDWDWPEFPSADLGESLTPLKLEVHRGDPDLTRKSAIFTRDQKAKQELLAFRQVYEKQPDDAKACNDLAWVYLTAPEVLGHVKAALPLAEKALRLEPGNATYANTLGVAYYRNKRYREAVDILRSNLKGGEDWSLAFDLYFLAMSYHKLSEPAQARVYFDWATRWPRTNETLSPAHLEELDMFRAEAVEVLGVADKGVVEFGPPPRVKQ